MKLIETIEIPGTPRSKKTHNQAFIVKGRPIVLPSKQFTQYQKHCVEFFKDREAEPYSDSIGIRLTAYMENHRGRPDHVGLLQSLGDILEHCGVIENDRIISWVDDRIGGWLQYDSEFPRVVLEIFST